MYDENQIVQVRWNNCNKDWYESKGYIFSGYLNYFDVKARDLMPKSAVRVNVTCDYCWADFSKEYHLVAKGRTAFPKDACAHCSSNKRSEMSKRRRAEKYIGLARKACEEKGYMLLTTEDEYTDIKMFVDFICPKHGKQTIRVEVLIRGGGCLPCAIEYRARNLSLTPDEVRECVEAVNGNKLLNSDEYVNNYTTNLKIECSCGDVFETSLAIYNRGKNKCDSCSQKESKGEEIIRKFLEDNGVYFEQEKRFDDCRDIKPLPFDFYIPERNMAIEFDGNHHYYDTGRGNFEYTQRHDQIKNQYCKDNNINLLRIPYWEGNNTEEIIAKELKLNL